MPDMNISNSTVTAITIPEGQVKSWSSGKTTLWGQVSPYRKLEYIKFNGAEYINTGIKPALNQFYYLDFKLNSSYNKPSAMPIMTASNSALTYRMYYCLYNTNTANLRSADLGYYQMSNSASSNSLMESTDFNYLANDINFSKKWEVRWRTYDNNYTHWVCFRDLDAGQDYGSYVTSRTTNQYNFTNTGNINLMRGEFWTSSGNIYKYAKGYVYQFFIRNGDGSAAISHKFTPAQRKSDGRCGLYDENTGTFVELQGTTTGEAACGPTVIENWFLS